MNLILILSLLKTESLAKSIYQVLYHGLITYSIKLGHAANQTQGSSSMLSLTDFTVNLATDAHQSSPLLSLMKMEGALESIPPPILRVPASHRGCTLLYGAEIKRCLCLPVTMRPF